MVQLTTDPPEHAVSAVDECFQDLVFESCILYLEGAYPRSLLQLSCHKEL